MSSAPDLPPADDAGLRAAVAKIFSVFQRAFGQRWAQTFADDKSRGTWLAALRYGRVSPAMIDHGLAEASQLEWPPSVGEFIRLCRPRVPDEAAGLAEALRANRGEWSAHEWSHPVIAATAREVGDWQLRSLDARQLRQVWSVAWAQMVARYARGESLDRPAAKALPREVRVKRSSVNGVPSSVAAELAKVRDRLGLSSC